MSFFKFLHGIGDRLGILETVPGQQAAPSARIRTRTVTLRELSSEIRSGEVRALADAPEEFSIPFEKIFEAAGISSRPEDWNVEKLKVAVAEAGKNKPREEVQRALVDILSAAGVSAENLVKDAIARDEALDSYESRVAEKMRQQTEAGRNRSEQIEQKIRDLQEQIARINAALESDREKWKQWRKLKMDYERELASAVSYIVDRPVVTTGSDDE